MLLVTRPGSRDAAGQSSGSEIWIPVRSEWFKDRLAIREMSRRDRRLSSFFPLRNGRGVFGTVFARWLVDVIGLVRQMKRNA